MFWIIVFTITVLGAAVQLLLTGVVGLNASHIAEVSLVWLLGGFYGYATFAASLQHLTQSDKAAQYIGRPVGSGFQLELGWQVFSRSGCEVFTSWLQQSRAYSSTWGQLLYMPGRLCKKGTSTRVTPALSFISISLPQSW